MITKILITMFMAGLFFGCASTPPPAAELTPLEILRQRLVDNLTDVPQETRDETGPVATKRELGRRADGTVTGYEYVSILTGNVVATVIVDHTGRRALSGRIPNGLVVQHSPGGYVIAERNYNAGQLEGEVIEFDARGNAVRVADYREGKLHGLVQEFTPAGRLIEERNYRAGMLHGPARTFTRDGALVRVVHYRNNERCGIVREFFPAGAVKTETSYFRGLRGGYHREFNNRGILQAEYYYARGILNGLSRFFYEEGTIHQEVRFANGVRQGDTRIFSIANPHTPIYVDTYRNGTRVRRRAFSASGELLFSLDF
ncbi:MAG: toxin-antitoxin system YwqK family antitoxin [Elusimicrobia bacterium]|nr:toxin-antitoxin system YwqK family antitoxin [Elusimicrobiota bacterium]